MRNRFTSPEDEASQMALLLRSVTDYAIYMLDTHGEVVSWNAGGEQIKGYTAEEIIGQHFSRFYTPEDVAAGAPAHGLDVARNEGRFEDEGWRVRKDGTLFWANVVITALRDSGGRLVGFAKVTRDLTERRNAELRAIEDARRLAEVEAANRARSEFVAALSHELRTPLNAIGGYVDLLLLGVRGELGDGQREDLQRVRRSQQHLLAIINDLLNFSRLEAGRVNYEIGPIHVGPVVSEVCALLEPQASAAGIELTCKCQDAVAFADEAKFEQIMLNLLGNNPEFFVARGNSTAQIILYALVLTLVPPLIGLGLEALARLVAEEAVAAVDDHEPVPASTIRTFHHRDVAAVELVERKGDRRISVCLPARDEAATMEDVMIVEIKITQERSDDARTKATPRHCRS